MVMTFHSMLCVCVWILRERIFFDARMMIVIGIFDGKFEEKKNLKI